MKALRFIVALGLLVALPILVLAQDVPPPSDFDPMQLLAAFVAAVKGGQWPVALVLGFVGAIWVLRKFGLKWIPWLGTSEGGTALAFLTVMGSVLGAAALAPGALITWSLVGKAAAAAFAAIGAWTGARRLLRLLVPVVAKIPGVGDALAKLLSWLSGADVAAKVEATAQVVPVPAGMTPEQAAALLAKPPSRT